MASKKRTGKPAWDRESNRKVSSRATIKNLPVEDQETLWELCHPTDSSTPAYTVEECLVHLLEEHNCSVKKSAFYEWHSWYGLELKLAAAEAKAQQSREAYARLHPEAAMAELDAVAQFTFTNQTMEDGDILNYTRLKRTRLLEKAATQKDEEIGLKDRLLKQKDKIIAQNERKVKLLEKKAALVDAAKGVLGDGKLTEEEKAATVRRLFRMG